MGAVAVEALLFKLVDLGVKVKTLEGKLVIEGNLKAIDSQTKAQIVAAKEQIIAYLQKAAAGNKLAIDLDRPLLDTAEYPLSFAQQRLWLIEQMQPGGAQYHMPLALTLSGQLNEQALTAALCGIIERHQVLRTVYRADEQGHARLALLEMADFAIEQIDLSHLDEHARQAEVALLARQAAAKPFDLANDYMLRACLVSLSEGQWLLLMTAHHIASDGWSMGVLIEELGALYRAQVENQSTALPPLPLQYCQYAQWQREYLEGDNLKRGLDYWVKQLADLPQTHQLPLDKPRPKILSQHGDVWRHRIDQATLKALNALCLSHDATLFMLLNAALSAVLGQFSAQKDIVLGTPIANREQDELAPLVGFFVNTLVVRNDLSGDPSFDQLLAQSKQTLRRAYEHQQVPFDLIVEQLQPARSLSHNPLFQVMLVLQNNQSGQLQLPQLQLAHLPSDSHFAKFDLNVDIGETEQGLEIAWEYATDLFESWSIKAMAGAFEQLLKAVACDSSKTLSELSMPAVHGLQGQRQDTSAMPSAFYQPISVYAQKQPQLIALQMGQYQLTYAELEAQANGLAAVLGEQSNKTAQVVGLCLPSGIDMVVALLAIAKSGAAYLPLDPEYPKARIEYMIETAAVQTVVSSDAYSHLLPSACQIVDCKARSSQPTFEASNNDLAYVMFTSGSTGKPKGVQIKHRGLVNYLEHCKSQYFQGKRGGVVSSSLSFDATLTTLLAPLYCGLTVELLPEGNDRIEALANSLIQANAPWVFKVTPAHLDALSDWLPADKVAAQGHLLVVGGEQLHAEQARKVFRQWLPQGTIINEYGPTETVVGCSWHQIDSQTRLEQSGVAIGLPIVNTRLYVLDDNCRPVPTGAIGELCIAGAGVALGYVNQPQITAEQFIDDSFGGSGKCYRSGDLVRVGADGLLHYYGRCDQQLKVRGYRIEAEEVCRQIGLFAGVEGAAVTAVNDGKTLAAYVVASELNKADLLAHLSAQLPSFMVPDSIIAVERLPLTANGKVDLKALKALKGADDCGSQYQAPQSDSQQHMVEIWQRLLQRERVGIEDNFFALGGHSLLATELAATLRQQRGVEVPIAWVFEYQTPKALDNALLRAEKTKLPPIEPQPQQDLPLSFAQQRLWLLAQIEPDSHHYNMPYSLRLTGRLNQSVLRQTLEKIIERHQVLRTIYVVGEDAQVVQRVLCDYTLSLTEQDCSTLDVVQQTSAVAQAAKQCSEQPFDLSRDLMLRCHLLKLADDHHLLFLTLHHIASDGWSMGILTEELGQFYGALSQGQEVCLPCLEIQYRDYALWQRNWLQGEVQAQQLQYWRDKLKGIAPVHQLPLDKPRPAQPSYRGAVHQQLLSMQTLDGLNQIARQHSASLFMVLHAVMSCVVSRFSGEDDVVIGTTIANREHAQLAPLVGFFVNNLVLRSNLQGNPDFAALLTRSRETLLDAYAHQQLPFDVLVDGLNVPRSTAYSPLCQIMMVMQNNRASELVLPGLAISQGSDNTPVATFDLLLDIAEVNEGLQINWTYALDLFDASTIERFAAHFAEVAKRVVKHPQQDLRQLNRIAENELELVTEWGQSQPGPVAPGFIHQWVEQQAQLRSDAIALVCAERQMSYGELNCKANQLACGLRARGVGPDELVLICLPRSVEMIVAMLAVAKAGGACVPVDPAYPAARIEGILADCQAKVALCFDNAPSQATAQWLNLAEFDTLFGQHSGDNLSLEALQPSHLAYVIYTSGSTGKPKGVMVSHGAIGASTADRMAFYDSPKVGFGLVSSIAFDISIGGIWWTLASGAKLLIASEEELTSPDALLDGLAKHRIGYLMCIPSLYREMLHVLRHSGDQARSAQLSESLQGILVGGEALSAEVIAAHDNQWQGECDLYNEYGPTEAAVWSSCRKVEGDCLADNLSIGRSPGHARLWVLDKYMQPVPMGVTGRLYIGGATLARGYLGQPELSQQTFIETSMGRLYDSGDLAYWRRSGQLVFVGRADKQVKLNGYRIEPDEIAKVISSLGGVSEAVVLACGEPQRLVAYCVFDNRHADTDALAEDLIALLPDYMQPAQFVTLDAMPRLPNGKVDSANLPDADQLRPKVQFAAPIGQNEVRLAQLWQSLLGIASVGRNDNFFELGGHSLLATRLATDIQIHWQLNVPVKTLFEHQTLAAQAALIDKQVALAALVQTEMTATQDEGEEEWLI